MLEQVCRICSQRQSSCFDAQVDNNKLSKWTFEVNVSQAQFGQRPTNHSNVAIFDGKSYFSFLCQNTFCSYATLKVRIMYYFHACRRVTELWLHDASGWNLSSVCVSIWYDPLFNSSSTNAHMDHRHTQTHTHRHVHTLKKEQLKETAHPSAHPPSFLIPPLLPAEPQDSSRCPLFFSGSFFLSLFCFNFSIHIWKSLDCLQIFTFSVIFIVRLNEQNYHKMLPTRNFIHFFGEEE